MDTKTKTVLWDILAGIVSSVISFIILSNLNLNIALIAISPFPLIAGIIRGKNRTENIYVKILSMNILFLLLIMAVMNGVFHLIIIIIIGLIGTSLGIYIRLFSSKFKIRSLGFLSLYFMSVILIALIALPTYFDAIMWKKVNIKAPDFTLLTFEGDTIKSSEYNDQVIILDFWATWCSPCIKQFPEIEKLVKENKNNNDITFFVINPLLGGDTYDKALNFINQKGYDLPFVSDIESLTYKSFKISALPCLIIIDKEGMIRYKHTGYQEFDNFHKILQKRLDLILNQSKTD